MRTERDDDGVVGGGGLQLEVEGPTELLAQREAEGPVDPTAVERMDDQLHPAGLVEEPFHHQLVQRGGNPERGATHREVVDDHPGGVGTDAGVGGEPTAGGVRIAGGEVLIDPGPKIGDLGRQLVGARRRLAGPERHRRWRVARVAHPHNARLDLTDLPRVGAEQKDVTRHRLHRPVFVDRADEGVVGVGHHAKVADVGDGAP